MSDRRLNVLLVDDDPVVRQAIERAILQHPALLERGVRTLRAGDGRRALGMLKKELPDAIVVDLFMPNMDGFALCRALRASEDAAHLPVVLISGMYQEDEQVRQLCQEVGATFLPKPVDGDALARAILDGVDGTGPAPVRAPATTLVPAHGGGLANSAPAGQVSPGLGERPITGAYASPRASTPTLTPAHAPPPGALPTTPRGHVEPGSGTQVGVGPRRHGTVLGIPVPEDSGSLPILLPEPSAAPPAVAQEPIVGTLSERPVARLLFDHLDAGSTGQLQIQRGQLRKEIYLHDGRPVGAGSNLRQEALGSLLVARGIIDEEQLSLLLGEMKKTGEKMGAVLVQLGWLTPEDVLRFLAAQARKRIVDCLRLADGTYTFVPGASFLEREIEHDLDVPRFLFAGLQKTTSADRLVERLVERHGGDTVVATPRWAKYRPLFEEVFGAESARILAERPGVGPLALRPDAAQVLIAVEAAALCGLVEFEVARGARTSALPSPEAAARSSMSLESLGARGSAPPGVADSPGELELDLVGEALARIDDLADPEGAAPSAPMSELDSGVVNINTLTASLAAQDGGPAANDPQAAVLAEYLRIHGKSLYQILDVAPDADIDEVVVAYEARTRSFAPDVFAGTDLGAAATKLESIRRTYDRALKVLANPKLRQAYDRERAEGGGADDTLGAELLFAEAQRLLEAGKLTEALSRFEAAAQRAPEEPTYQAHLGWAHYQAYGAAGAAKARAALARALRLDPDCADAHEFLGRLAAATGDGETARRALEQALALDPRRLQCLDALLPLHAENSEFHETERIYRRLIQALGDRHLPLRRRLWRELAALYEDEFDDHASARVAYDMAARLAPDDVELQRKVVTLNAHDLDRWKDIARAIAAEWRLRPRDAELGSALVDLLLNVGKHDAATLAASAMVLRGLGNDSHRALAERSAPRLLTRLAQTIEGSILQRIRHPGEDPEIEFLFATLATQDILPPFSDDEVGLTGQTPLAPRDCPEVFARVLDYVCGVLKVKVPDRLFAFDALEGDARLADTRPRALFVGPALLRSHDTVDLGFRLGRAMSFGTPGRLTGAARTGRQLKPYLLACMAFARQALSAGEIEVVPIVERLESCDATTRTRLKELGARLVRDRNAINLSAWAKALGRTANRLGLLVSGDLLRVGRALGEEEGMESVDELLDFALSLDHFDLREELGISSVV